MDVQGPATVQAHLTRPKPWFTVRSVTGAGFSKPPPIPDQFATRDICLSYVRGRGVIGANMYESILATDTRRLTVYGQDKRVLLMIEKKNSSGEVLVGEFIAAALTAQEAADLGRLLICHSERE